MVETIIATERPGKTLDRMMESYSLTDRELEVLGLIANGDSNVRIADKLLISERSVENHAYSIYSKLPIEWVGVNPRVKAAGMYMEEYKLEFIKQSVEVHLTPREREVYSLIAEGYYNSRIAGELLIEETTVDHYVNSIYSKLGIVGDNDINTRVLATLMFDKVVESDGHRDKTGIKHKTGIDALTTREFQVLGLIANADSNLSIADRLNIEIKTVDHYVNSIYSRLGIVGDNDVNPRVKAAGMYMEEYKLGFIKQRVEVDLTRREYEIYSLIAKGYSNSRIAGELVVERRTVESHVNSIFRKLPLESYGGVNRRVLAMLMFDRVAEPKGYKTKGFSDLVLIGSK